MRARLGFASTFLAVSLLSADAAADLVVAAPSSTSTSSSASSSRSASAHDPEFYGWVNMAVGGAGATSLLGLAALLSLDGGGGSDAGAGTAGAVALGTYLLGGPIVHVVHDRWGKAFGALGLLAGLPATGALIGYGASDGCSGDSCREDAAVWGGIAGGLAAPIVDGLALGWASKGDTGVAAAPVLPFAMPQRGGAIVGVGGVF